MKQVFQRVSCRMFSQRTLTMYYESSFFSFRKFRNLLFVFCFLSFLQALYENGVFLTCLESQSLHQVEIYTTKYFNISVTFDTCKKFIESFLQIFLSTQRKLVINIILLEISRIIKKFCLMSFLASLQNPIPKMPSLLFIFT